MTTDFEFTASNITLAVLFILDAAALVAALFLLVSGARCFVPILRDSVLETIDFKIFYILLGLSVALALLCACITFPRRPVEEALNGSLQLPGRKGQMFKVTDVKTLEESVLRPTGRYEFTLIPELPSAVQDFREGAKVGAHELNRPDIREAASKFLAKMPLNPMTGYSEVKVLAIEPESDNSLRFRVEALVNWQELPRGHDVAFLFGLWKAGLPLPMGLLTAIIQITLIEYIAGWVGIIISVIISAGFIPNMLRKGTVDLLLVKPVSRPVLLLYKYLGGLTFVALNAVVLVGSTWIVFGFTLGNWSIHYLASALVLVFYFAILYSLSALVGVITRSQLAAVLVTMGFWFFLWLVGLMYGLAHDTRVPFTMPATLVSFIDAVHFILPRTGDLSALNQYMLLETNGMIAFLSEEKQQAAVNFSWKETIITSAAFISVMLGLACWRFSRKDY